jgi:hypothetical protein
MIDNTIKNRIEELKLIQNDLTTSDLQGIIGAIALNINKKEYFQIEDLILSFVYGDIDLNKCLNEIEVLN